jgi:hypothetical protein
MFGKIHSTETAEVEKTWLLVDANTRAAGAGSTPEF